MILLGLPKKAILLYTKYIEFIGIVYYERRAVELKNEKKGEEDKMKSQFHRAAVISILALTIAGGYFSGAASTKIEPGPISKSAEETEMIKKIVRTEKEWKKILTPEEYLVLRQAGTERPFSGKYNDHKEKGTYFCAACGTPLFRSAAKYDHGSGWPSFTAPIDSENVEFHNDPSHGMIRTEVRCAACGSHLGHVFNDGPPPTGLHFCINSVALDFQPTPTETTIGEINLPDKKEIRSVAVSCNQDASAPAKRESLSSGKTLVPSSDRTEQNSAQKENTALATFAAGCFWGVEDKFHKVKGVISTRVGYTGGTVRNPTYKQVCSDKTGHAEAVEVIFDPAVVTYNELLQHFFRFHDPTQVNRQGPDIGTQYRSAIFYHDGKQKDAAEKMIQYLNQSGAFDRPIATQVVPASEFYQAEDYHQRYYEKLRRGKGGI